MRIIVGITGASGVMYGIRLLELLREYAETHLILSEAAEQTIACETLYSVGDVAGFAAHCHSFRDIAAPPASGSFLTGGMVIVPCSMKTLSAVVNSYSDSLLVRAADVTLKERRRLVLAPREMPLHSGHLRLMLRAASMGAVICPCMPGFYHRPQNVADIVDFTVGKLLDTLGIEHALCSRWGAREAIEA